MHVQSASVWGGGVLEGDNRYLVTLFLGGSGTTSPRILLQEPTPVQGILLGEGHYRQNQPQHHPFLTRESWIWGYYAPPGRNATRPSLHHVPHIQCKHFALEEGNLCGSGA